ncbi:MAG TPA: STAS domain-containing protein [Trebonia sp.]
MSLLSLSVAVHQSTGAPVVRLAGEVDVTTRGLEVVLGVLAAKRPRLLLVDVSALAFIDCAALGVVLRARRELGAAGCELALAGPSGEVARLLDLTGAGQVTQVYASADEAAAAAC